MEEEVSRRGKEPSELWKRWSRRRGRCSVMVVRLRERHREEAAHPSQAKHHLVKAVVNTSDHKLLPPFCTCH